MIPSQNNVVFPKAICCPYCVSPCKGGFIICTDHSHARVDSLYRPSPCKGGFCVRTIAMQGWVLSTDRAAVWPRHCVARACSVRVLSATFHIIVCVYKEPFSLSQHYYQHTSSCPREKIGKLINRIDTHLWWCRDWRKLSIL